MAQSDTALSIELAGAVDTDCSLLSK